MTNRGIFKNACLWAQPLTAGQNAVLEAIKSFIPNDVDSILDVGCGDGKVTNILKNFNRFEITGVDLSNEALAHCNFNTTLADSVCLPFADSTFDLVLTMDMLEHLDDISEVLAFKELFRVARNYVIVVVPYNENLMDGLTLCSKCGHKYHINYHLRSYQINNLINKAPIDWCANLAVLTGEQWIQKHNFETELRKTKLSEFNGWNLSPCPLCGSESVRASEESTISDQNIIDALSNRIYNDRKTNTIKSHSEILLLFSKSKIKRNDSINLIETISHSIKSSAINTSLELPSAYFNTFPKKGRYIINKDKTINVQLPVYSTSNSIKFTLSDQDKVGKIFVVDNAGLLIETDLSNLQMNVPHIFSFDRSISPTSFGLIIYIKCYDDNINLSVELDSGVEGFILKPKQTEYFYRISNEKFDIYMQLSSDLWMSAYEYEMLKRLSEVV